MIQRRPASFELPPDTVVDTLGEEPYGDAQPAPAQAELASEQPGEPALAERELRLEEFFNGRLWAEGVLCDRRGRVRRRLRIDMQALWEGDWGRLQESYVFDDGERQQRTWSLRRFPGHDGVRRYEATAADVVGTARGRAQGNEMRWSYVLDVPLGRLRVRLRMDDRMYLVGDALVLNRIEMRKFGVRVGSLLLSCGRTDATADLELAPAPRAR
jgi:hypothetical protein